MNGKRAKFIHKASFGDMADIRAYVCLESNKTTAYLGDCPRAKYKFIKKAWKDRKKV